MDDLVKRDPKDIEPKPPKEKKPAKDFHPDRFIKKNKVTIQRITAIALLLLCVCLLFGSIDVGAKAAKESYEEVYAQEKDTVVQEYYQRAYDKAEAENHITSLVIIRIENVQEVQNLEVLKVYDTEIVTKEKTSKFAGIDTRKVTAWFEVKGHGTYIVDLKAAEFIKDDERQYVLVRVPAPELTDITCGSPEEILYHNKGIGDGNDSEGTDLANEAAIEAQSLIENALRSNQYMYVEAKKSAESSIQNLVKQFNPDIPDLVVEVEFME